MSLLKNPSGAVYGALLSLQDEWELETATRGLSDVHTRYFLCAMLSSYQIPKCTWTDDFNINIANITIIMLRLRDK